MKYTDIQKERIDLEVMLAERKALAFDLGIVEKARELLYLRGEKTSDERDSTIAGDRTTWKDERKWEYTVHNLTFSSKITETIQDKLGQDPEGLLTRKQLYDTKQYDEEITISYKDQIVFKAQDLSHVDSYNRELTSDYNSNELCEVQSVLDKTDFNVTMYEQGKWEKAFFELYQDFTEDRREKRIAHARQHAERKIKEKIRNTTKRVRDKVKSMRK